MSAYLGDFAEDATVNFYWATNNKSGASINPTTAGTIRVYKGSSSVEVTNPTGIADTRGFDSLTGVHHCSIDLGANAFYAAGFDYNVVLVGAVIDGETINVVLAAFSIANRFAGSPSFEKAAKILINKAVQNKSTGEIQYYDDDGTTVILTHIPTDEESTITRIPS